MKILYIMNVDWNWIKQRPHFLAEGLGNKHDVKVFYQHRYSRKNYQERKLLSNIEPVYVIPKGDKIKFLKCINQLIWKGRMSIEKLRNDYDFIYLTYPSQIEYVKNLKNNIIYDCMDNHCAFIKDERKKAELIQQENSLVKKAAIILCSSEKLKLELIAKYGKNVVNKTYVVRNGYDGTIIEKRNAIKIQRKKIILSYVGTISEWFDFELLKKSIEDFPEIEYRLYGPCTDEQLIPRIENIKYLGTLEHNKIYESIKDSDCLIMPFKVNDIIESVDPVKLYEYINFDKNIISVYYNEIDRFRDFVYFYNNYSDYKQILGMIKEKNEIKYNESERRKFLSSNTWGNRIKEIENILTNYSRENNK